MKRTIQIDKKECEELLNIYEKVTAYRNLLKIVDKEMYLDVLRKYDIASNDYISWWASYSGSVVKTKI